MMLRCRAIVKTPMVEWMASCWRRSEWQSVLGGALGCCFRRCCASASLGGRHQRREAIHREFTKISSQKTRRTNSIIVTSRQQV